MATTVLGLKTFAASDPVDYNEINDNYNKIDNGVKTAMQGRAAHNLLDNSDFRNPVNQRGQSSYTGSKYGIDRWRTWNDSATITITSNGIKGDGTEASVLYQDIEPKKVVAGKSYTVAAGYSDGSVSCKSGVISTDTNIGIWTSTEQVFFAYSDGKPFVRLWHATKTIAWADLYEGSYTADTLPAYQPKGYAAELAECQRYFWRCNNTWFAEGSGYASSDTQFRVSIVLPQMMRVTPTMISSTGDTTTYGIKIHTAGGANITPNTVTFSMKNNRIALVLTGTFTNGELGVLRLENDYLDFSADL